MMAKPSPPLAAKATTQGQQPDESGPNTLQNDLQKEAAKKAAKSVKKSAKAAANAAKDEFENKLRCVQHEQTVRLRQSHTSDIHTAPPPPSKSYLSLSAIKSGDYVVVSPDLSPGMSSYGGFGWVTDVSGTSGKTTITVRYIDGSAKKQETNIPINRVTVSTTPFQSAGSSNNRKILRERINVVHIPVSKPKPQPKLSLALNLKQSASSNKGKGWRKRELGLQNEKRGSQKVLHALSADYRELKSYHEGLSALSDQNFLLHDNKGKNGQFKKRKTKHNPLSVTYLAFAWGCSRSAPSEAFLATEGGKTRGEIRSQKRLDEKPDVVPVVQGNVIENRAYAASLYTPKYHFVCDYVGRRIVKEADTNHQLIDDLKKKAGRIFPKLPSSDKAFWNLKAREHDERQPYIKDAIIHSLQTYGSKSFRRVERDIGGWCSASTICRWFKSKETYSTYTERVLPLLSSVQREKHVEFSTHLRNRWGLPEAKYLWVHYDEKWFWGLVARSNAKMCEEMGLVRKYYQIYHKNHINKVMVLASTAIWSVVSISTLISSCLISIVERLRSLRGS